MQLNLTLYKKWFYQILDGKKKIEYRENKKYWQNRFRDRQKYDKVLFTNGYGKDKPFMLVELKKINETKNFFELHLGKILKSGNIA